MMEEARTKDDLSIDPDASGTLSAQLTLQAQNSSKLNSKVSLGSDTESVISINPAGVSKELPHMRGYSAATSEPSAESSVMLQTAMHHNASSTKPSDDVIDAVAAVLKFGMRKWGTDAFMNIQMARFYWVYRANPHKMAMALQAAFGQKPLIDYGKFGEKTNMKRMRHSVPNEMCRAVVMIAYYHLMLERKLKGGEDMRINDYLLFQEQVMRANQRMATSIIAQTEFWSELMTDQPDMQRLMGSGLVCS